MLKKARGTCCSPSSRSSGWKDWQMKRQASLWEFNFGSCVVCCCHKRGTTHKHVPNIKLLHWWSGNRGVVSSGMTCTYTWIHHEFVTRDVDTCTNRTCLVALGGNILEHICFQVIFFFIQYLRWMQLLISWQAMGR